MALPALIPAGGLALKGAIGGISAATAAKAAAGAAAVGVAGAAAAKAAAGASVKAAAGASARAAASKAAGASAKAAANTAKAASGKAYESPYADFYAKAAKAKKYSTDTGSGSSTVKDAAEATGKGAKGAFKKIKGFIAKASKVITWPFLLFSGSSYEGEKFGVRFNGVNEVKGKNGTYYVPAVGLNGGHKQNRKNGYRSSKYRASNYSTQKSYKGKYRSSSRSGKSSYNSRSSTKRRH